jgi:outer membrane protein
VEANKIGYKIGTRINIDVLDAEQQLYAAQRDLAKSRAETLMSGLRLKASTGALDITDVEALNGLLEQAPE